MPQEISSFGKKLILPNETIKMLDSIIVVDVQLNLIGLNRLLYPPNTSKQCAWEQAKTKISELMEKSF